MGDNLSTIMIVVVTYKWLARLMLVIVLAIPDDAGYSPTFRAAHGRTESFLYGMASFAADGRV